MQKDLPFELGYRMPAEWEKHEATWLSWPKNPETFPGELLPEVETTYMRIIDTLHKGEIVNILVDDQKSEKRVRNLLDSDGISGRNIILHVIPTVDVWFRDYGPIFVSNKPKGNELAFTHWNFNAWGNKYEDLKQDSSIPEKIPLSKFKRFETGIVLEGGSIDVNGAGTCLTTEQCLLNKNRNPNLSRSQIERYLMNYLGATNVVWLKEGIAGDDTDGHVDDIARFVSRDKVVCVSEEAKSDANYKQLRRNLEILEHAKDQDGGNLEVIPMPMPGKVVYKGQRLPASYANFYIANKAVLVPIFNSENDLSALETLQSLFPGRSVVGIDCRALVYGFGSIHCITQQQPATGR